MRLIISSQFSSSSVKIPKQLAIVLDTENPEQYLAPIANVVDSLVPIQNVENIYLFFTHNAPEIKFGSEKVIILDQTQVNKTFYDTMKNKQSLDQANFPFKAKLDLAVIYTHYPNLCNCFTWTLDLTTLSFPGPISMLSRQSINEAFDRFAHSEQRCGK